MPFKEILVTLDGSDTAEAALGYAERIAAPGAHIHILNVAPHAATTPLDAPSELHSTQLMRDVNWPPLSYSDENQTLYERENYVRGCGSWLIEKGFEVSSQVKFGDVVDSIVETSGANFEVIVMTTHGRTGLARLAVGSVAEAVLRRATCPVLLIPARALKESRSTSEGTKIRAESELNFR